MLENIPFSLLELASVREGDSIATTLDNTRAYAQHADGLGFKRFWLAEHHNMEGIASSATAVLVGHIAGATSRLRVGSGGIMLPNHPPLVIAEQFGTLASLYPNRIDLGLGRAPGTDPLTSRALRRDNLAADTFPEEVELLQRLLEPLTPNQAIKAIPGAGTQVPIWLLGSSLFSAQLAAEKGLPYAFAGHFAPRYAYEAAALYREQFQPSSVLERPYFMLGLPLIAAPSQGEALFLATAAQQRILALLRGQPLWLKPPVESMEGLWTIAEEDSVRAFLQLAVIGDASHIRQRLQYYAQELGVDEFMFTIDMYEPEHRRRALDILRQAQAKN
jgi:luciferase family oxidoreductase group 1